MCCMPVMGCRDFLLVIECLFIGYGLIVLYAYYRHYVLYIGYGLHMLFTVYRTFFNWFYRFKCATYWS